MTVRLNTIEARIVEILRRRYPITVEELREEMSIRRDTLRLALKSLESKGVLALEPLPDKTYVRLLTGVVESGTVPQQAEGWTRDQDDIDMAYR
ncbi:MAG: GntR family transcriptional regulator [Thermoplasmata archaeon]|nr:GntR family transcriptional regulator [Thermoplasmata archaeon]